MNTYHKLIIDASKDMNEIKDKLIHLIKNGFANVYTAIDFRYKSRFLNVVK